ncbi:MAG TPA: RagB/SusD family nutrient uptake outer membrane protein, partial [Puia sp.]|nr:RagB/SusD family nutrient uptake outer membrane protein [Puia sp.]
MRYIFLVIITAAALSSCKKVLDEAPESIAAENFYNKPAEVEAGLNAIYTPLRDGNGLGALYQTQLECYADYMYGRGSHAILSTYQGLDNTNITRVATMWGLFYLSIRNANIMVQKIPLAKSVSDAAKAQYLAEAKYLRALDYFYLVRNWAGVPLRTETNMDSISLKRSSAADVYALILSDLQFAEANLPDAGRLVGAPSKWAAKTVLTEVYMWLGQDGDADNKAKEVIASGKFSLVKVSAVPDFDKLYGPDVTSSTEEIFYLKFSRSVSGQGWQYPIYA